ncbi:lipopolysaccharide biosynthesis protein [Shewanella maritima]|uniref:lipopolysaccharide biosynthesis protein n=1 Tax=Shewanella maritima TaxID=2520507 RepID=UPI001F5ED10B|nr:lipopolysaccharide biosynthesis protein [Shewanella maritima]
MSNAGGTDSELVKAYINSEDMLNHLNSELGLFEHYTSGNVDFFSRLASDATKEEFYEYYLKRTIVTIDDKSGVISVFSQGFSPEYAHQLTVQIIDRAEWYINSIGHQLAEAQLKFIRQEHSKVENRLHDAKKQLIGFQQNNNLLDPEAEGIALQQIAYGMEAEVAKKRAELKTLKSIMTDQAPQVMILQAELDALEKQLATERQRLSLAQNETAVVEGNYSGEPKAISQVLANYSDYKIELELALQAYTSSEISLEKSRIEAYRQLKYLIVVESATTPEDYQYPQIIYNLTLFAVILIMLFTVGKIVLATARELN